MLPCPPACLASGYHYYVNHKTGETSWEKPKALGTEDLDDGTAATGTAVAATTAEEGYAAVDTSAPGYVDSTGYTQVWDDASQAYYYFHEGTQDTRWDPPPGWGTPAPADDQHGE